MANKQIHIQTTKLKLSDALKHIRHLFLFRSRVKCWWVKKLCSLIYQRTQGSFTLGPFNTPLDPPHLNRIPEKETASMEGPIEVFLDTYADHQFCSDFTDQNFIPWLYLASRKLRNAV